MDLYLNIFRYLQDNPKCRKLNSEEKKGIIKLLLISTSKEAQPFLDKYTLVDLQELVTEALNIHENCGEEALTYFCSAPSLLNGASLEDLIASLKFINNSFQDLNNVDKATRLLFDFSQDRLNLSGLLKYLDKQASNMH